ncbi:hypothetical protein A8W25_19075 [Streptomyces sp. ERV7]|uniref:hypothetical protein n=1 Tax=Streptomyces sp. ERV7 TaxID=1322334 RepID=UPI0007F46DA8|nr:hypothetical protein [Streptomyces sp. ERV7]OAR24497.1 hypothetical protein A8W25_19075 [Streptomyces sp. ERV7]
MARRPVAVVAAIVLLGEAVGIVLVNWFLGRVVHRQHMSLGGVDSDTMSTTTYAMGGVFGFYLAVCGVILLLTGVRDRAPGRVGRILLISCAVVHGVLGALTVGLIGWTAFAFMMVVLALVVLVLLMYAPPALPAEPEDGEPAEAPPGNGTPPEPAAA